MSKHARPGAVEIVPAGPGQPGHRRTDPACMWHRQPRGRLGWWWFNRGRGKACMICMDIRGRCCRVNEDCILTPHGATPCLVLR